MTPVQAPSRGPQVRDDMTVELALSVMAGAGAGHLFLCDEDDQRTRLITRARLIEVREGPAYSDQVRLRDVFTLTR
ncbi:CBS domain-containing protein [Streptomyces sp. NPDC051214]|uniref:CBS domain-containing protein n=1 Tax=Streptomyces sp. NPDC051214 TaxID=3155282 RepID=UPI003438AA11